LRPLFPEYWTEWGFPCVRPLDGGLDPCMNGMDGMIGRNAIHFPRVRTIIGGFTAESVVFSTIFPSSQIGP